MSIEADDSMDRDNSASLTVIDGGKAADKLTARQQGFVNSILAGEDQVACQSIS
jgi:hypothetical protein